MAPIHCCNFLILLCTFQELLAFPQSGFQFHNGASKEYVAASTSPIKASAAKLHIMFLAERYHWSKRLSHWGWYVNNEGEVFTFSYASLYPTLQYKQQPKLVSHIPDKVLAAKAKLIEPASHQTVVPRRGGYDRGTRTFSAYLQDAKSGKYKRVVLLQTGDIEMVNRVREAKELAIWLKSIQPREDIP